MPVHCVYTHTRIHSGISGEKKGNIGLVLTIESKLMQHGLETQKHKLVELTENCVPSIMIRRSEVLTQCIFKIYI